VPQAIVEGMRIIRYVAGYAAVAAALPYVVLKISWLTGSTVGFNTATPVEDGFDELNAATMVMAMVAIAVALALTHRWGERLPAPLVLFPMWVGSGLLGPILIGVPVAVAIAGIRGEPIFDGGIVEGWIYKMVYAGFIVQGAALLTAFALYARRRWASIHIGRSDALGVLLGTTAGLLLFGVGSLYLVWIADSPLNGVMGVLSVLGGVAMLMLVRGKGGWGAIVFAWLGSGANFAWGLWVTVNALASSPVGSAVPAAMKLVQFLSVLTGMLAGLVAANVFSNARLRA
jgi:hypothetical protein